MWGFGGGDGGGGGWLFVSSLLDESNLRHVVKTLTSTDGFKSESVVNQVL